MRVHVVDPSSFTRPYDHALCAALAAEGADVELVTSRFVHGDAPAPEGYTLRESFYRRGGGRARKLLQHVPDMLAERRAAKAADVVHFQWLPLQYVDAHLLPKRPLVLTAHDVLPREPKLGQLAAQRRLYDRVDAVVAHTEHGRRRLVDELGVPGERVHVIGHGVLDGLAGIDGVLPPELADTDPGRPIVLFFGLLRPYKGLDVLLEAWRAFGDEPPAELWIVGAPRMDVTALRAASPPAVRWVPRFVSDAEAAAVFARATVAVLPYREIEQSGVLWTAVGLGTPVILSAVGGFAELEGALLVEPGDSVALHAALAGAIEAPPAPVDPAPHAWDAIAREHLALYATLVP
ncbi:MAG TPA: glycosyltransferase [Solirubrobacteraceae bacterium]|nr:glycosyltransferase [Solirubrobacteraceae bacterium]